MMSRFKEGQTLGVEILATAVRLGRLHALRLKKRYLTKCRIINGYGR